MASFFPILLIRFFRLAHRRTIDGMKTHRDQESLTPRQLQFLDARLDAAMPLTHTDPLPEDLLEDAEPSFEDLGY